MLELGVGADLLRAIATLHWAVMVALMVAALWFPKRAWAKALGIAVVLGVFLLPVLQEKRKQDQRRAVRNERYDTTLAMWKERCKTAGEFIHQTVEDVEGVYLLKLRPQSANFGAQFVMDDPYGSDAGGMGLIQTFVRQTSPPDKPPPSDPKGYRYVVAKDLGDGQLYRYTGRIEEPWQTDKSYLKGYTRLVVDKSPPPDPLPRYGVTWDDISTREDREHWIAGSSLKVIDLQTNQVIAERVGYMFDPGLGSTAGFRSPWLQAADTACPAFRDPSLPRVQPAFSYTAGQTYRFVSKVLKPKQ
jgi:hypothetical protein